MSIKLNDAFISYRREGGSELAQLVYKDLKKRGYRVFMDVRELRSGHFDSELRRQVSAAKDFILLLTPGCLDRCNEPNDWLLKEIEMALSLGLNIVPLVKTPFRIPDPADLPSELSELPRHNAIEYNHDKSDESLDLIVSRLSSKASWLQANHRRVTGISLVAAAIAVAMGVWIGFGKLDRKADLTQGDTSEIKEKTSALIESTEAIQNDSKVIKEKTSALIESTEAIQNDSKVIKKEILSQGKKTGEQIDSIGLKIDALAGSIQEGIGAANLGPDYDMVNAHRDFQDRYIKKGGSVDPLIDEYLRKTINHPENAMYYYLLSRLHSTYAANPSEARLAAEKGYKADKDFFWNARTLLYFTFSEELDIASLLDLETEYYKITKEEKSMFASGDSAQIMRAFEGIKARFKDDRRHDDLAKNRLCWHLFRALSEKPYSDLHGFRNLIGKEAVSSRNLVKLKVLDVKTGFDAISHVSNNLTPQGEGNTIVYLDVDEEGNQIPYWKREKAAAQHAKVVEPYMAGLYACAAPPVAVRLSVKAATFETDAIGNKIEFINLRSIRNRRFFLLSHQNQPPEEIVKLVGGGSNPFKKLNYYNLDASDVKSIQNYEDFWVVMSGFPVPWASSKGCGLIFDFIMRYKGNDEMRDQIFISSEEDFNLRKGNTEAAMGMELHSSIARIKNTRLHSQGHLVDKPVEAMIRWNAPQLGYMELDIYGLKNRPIRLMYGTSPTKKAFDLTFSGLPDNAFSPEEHAADDDGHVIFWAIIEPEVTEFLANRSNGEWIRFTGMAMHKSAGTIFMVPNSAESFTFPSKPDDWLQQAQELPADDRTNLLHE